ncbi:beta strand repeat-containing protein [Granulicella aggregans]|uniref:beta strand repeat-containing protein n=1 Tax=Granulicella aggregans TaxID=474949 RepID=UPI001C85F7C6|nr:chitobiase/beta-hexosaminidase C-terminal domain-containing protein [Granulicella aggregans]
MRSAGHLLSGLDFLRRGVLPALLILLFAAVSASAQSTFNITSATYGTGATSTVPAGVNGAVLMLAGTLPGAQQINDSNIFACFYTGYGPTSQLTLTPPGSGTPEMLTVPASVIQSIPQGNFTATNGYAVTAYVYFSAPDATCDGTFDASLTNEFPVSVVAPSLGTYSGPLAVPQTNSATSLRAAPLTLVLPASGVLPTASTVGATTVVFDSFGSITPVISGSALAVPIPAAFASSAAGTTASLTICNTFGTNQVCTTPTPAITLTVTALVASSGTLTATPTPVSVAGQTILTAQFSKAAGAGQGANPGAPSGLVTFTADGATVPAASLLLDTTATFVSQPSTVTSQVAPAPTFTPVAGSYLGVQTITIADSDTTAAIYYTQDGSTPTNGSTLYTAPFSISISQTIKAIAAVSGSLNSAVASVAYTVTVRPPTHLAFQVQPVSTGLNTAITPAVQVALLDSTGAVAAGATNAVTIAIGTNPGNGILSGTKTVNAVNGIATFSDLSIAQLGTGYTLSATSGSLTGAISSLFNITPPQITMTVQSTTPAGLVGVGATLNGSFTLGAPAPTGGVTVNLSSGTPANVTISPATVTVAAGQTTGSFTYTGVAAGSSTLSASATGYQTGTVVTTATMAQVSLGLIPNVAPGQTQSLALSLATAAPAGGTTVTFTIANTNIATVTQSVFVPAGAFTASTNPQVAGVLIGTTTVTANAPGYAPATRPVNVTVTATFNPGTTNLNLITSTNTVLQISAPAPAGGITFNLTSSDPTKATVPASVTVIQGGTNVKVPITGVADGTVTITASSTGITNATGTVNVNSTITSPDFTTGYDLQYYEYFSLPVTPSVPTNVTFKVSDPTVAIISTTQSAVGQQTLVSSNVTTGGIGYLYIQGKKVGTTTLTISAPGYTTGTETITVTKSGFAYYYTNANFTTTTYANPTTVTIYPFLLDANQSITGYPSYAINPGTPALSIPITSSDTTIGTVTSPVVFNPLDTGKSFTFTPVAAGTANLIIGAQPAGFTEPMQNSAPQYQTAVATVNTPVIVAPSNTTGVHLQNGISISLPVAPPTGITVTVTMTPLPAGMPLAATISKSQTVAGATTQTFTNVTSGFVGTLYTQGQSAGTATITVSAPGYTTGTNTITVAPSGFAYYYGNSNINTTSFSATSTLTVYPFLLDTSKAISGYPSYTINPGVGPITVPITNSDNTIGTISATSLTFNTNDNYQQFTFQPVSAGTDNITVGNVTGFTTPTTYQQATATVTAPSISVSGATTGVHMQNSIGIYLPVAPPSARTVTVSVPTAGVVTLSKDNVTVGTTTVTFTNVTTSYVGQVYIQGQGVGTATLTESAPGYVAGTSTLTVLNSGLGFYPGNGTFTTTTFSSPNTLTVYTLLLDANNNFANYGLPLSPGVGPVTVPLADSNTSVGTISSNALVFNTNESAHNFTFKPVSAGTANITIPTTPAGFTAPKATSTAGVATVTAPAISVSDSLTGINLETTLGIYLPQTPPNPITVTVKSNGPLIAVLSNGATVVGTGTLTFTNVTSTSVGTIYVQGLTEGSTTLKVSAPGYTDGDANIRVDQSGFSFYYGNGSSFTTSVGSNPTQLTVYPVALVHGTLTPDTYNSLYVSPQAGTVNVPITSSAPAVGTVASPLVFAPGASSENLTFTPVATGTSTLNIGTPTGFSVPTDYTTSTATVQ